MPLEGRFSVDVGFTDTSDAGGAQSLKRISLIESTSHSSGKVAVLTGTAGTAAVSLGTLGATTYRDASGQVVSFSAVTRVAFSWSATARRSLVETGSNDWTVVSKSGEVAMTGHNQPSIVPQISSGVGTGTYTIILYGT